mmetsp:Transcript_31041/g.73142  ORF Transcript_31041/g.73142 Transcript_31041/m.73142 type:complete len:247 (-) Transcript_31041:245-985(-)
MIDTASSTFTEFPLFGTHPSSSSSSSPSCSMEAIVIQRPLYTESYSWSDFPMVVQEDETSSSSCFNNNSSNHSNNYNYHCDYEFGRMRRDDSFSSSSSSLYSTSSLSSLDSSLSTASLSSQACSSPASHKASQQQQQPSRRNVRFAPSMGVRTYSLVLGDHPLCGDGLAIEHGWDFNEEQKEDRHETEMTVFMGRTSSALSCQKRSYLSRKQLLLDVAGCTKEQLDQRTEQLREERNRHHPQRMQL